MKVCGKCNQLKPLFDFASWRKGDSAHKRTNCKSCETESSVKLKESKKLAGNPTSPPIGTPCPICANASLRLCFDHDHATLAHRGWLCPQCNRAIGQLGDSVLGLTKAIDYLNKV